MKNLVFLYLMVMVKLSNAMATEVKLRVFGSQDNNSIITLCPLDNFIFVAECTVRESSTLVWSLRPLLSSTVGVTAFSNLGESREGSVTFVLAKKNRAQTASESSFTSQVQVYTDDIRDAMGDSGKFVIRCQDDTSTNYADVTLKLAAEDALIIITSASREANILSVSWSTNIAEIVNIVVIAMNTKSGVKGSTVVGGAEGEASLLVDHRDPYNVTVMVFDRCQQNFSSEEFYIEELQFNGAMSTATMTLMSTKYFHSSSSVFVPNSPALNQQCTTKEANNRGLIASNIVFASLVVLLVCVLIVLISWIYLKRRENKEPSMGKTPEKLSMEQHLHASNVKTDSNDF